MRVSFKNNKIEKDFNSIKTLSKKYGQRQAEKIMQRIQELESFNNLQELPKSARFHTLCGDRKNEFAVDLIHPYRLVFWADHKYDSYTNIEGVIIVEVVDYH